MILQVNHELCNGCGDCVSVCPSNAIRLEGGRAIIDEALCVGCQVCMGACTQDAITPVEAHSPVVQRTALATRQVEVLPARPKPTREKSTALSALVLAAGEILPRLAERLLNAWDGKLVQSRLTNGQSSARPVFVAAPRRSSAGGRAYRRRARYGRQEMERNQGRR
jgi:Fe-S-cluster-containing hydrogenase component 2